MKRATASDLSRFRTWLLALLGLLALAGNGLIVQTHRHPLARPFASAMATTGGDASADAHCALCDAQAAAEPFVPPQALSLSVPVVYRIVPALRQRNAVDRPSHTHAWRSRAPPLLALT